MKLTRTIAGIAFTLALASLSFASHQTSQPRAHSALTMPTINCIPEMLPSSTIPAIPPQKARLKALKLALASLNRPTLSHRKPPLPVACSMPMAAHKHLAKISSLDSMMPCTHRYDLISSSLLCSPMTFSHWHRLSLNYHKNSNPSSCSVGKSFNPPLSRDSSNGPASNN